MQGGRDGTWLTAARGGRGCIVLLFSNVAFLVLYVAIPQNAAASRSHWNAWFGSDFWNFWGSARLALNGQLAAVYDSAAHLVAMEALFQRVFGRSGGPEFMYPYPPPFLLVCAPLAVLPYPVATALWVLGGPTSVIVWLRRRLPLPGWLLPLLAFPGFFFNATCAQNACFTTLCFAGGTSLSRRHPFLAGCCLGVLAYKPHLLFVAPVAIFAARRWSTLGGIAASAVGLCAASWVVFGTSAWLAFAHSILVSQANVASGRIRVERVQTVFGLFRALHAGTALAYAAHAAAAIVALGGLVRVALRRPEPSALLAMTVATTLLLPAYVMDYDLVCLVVPMAWVAAEASRSGWLGWEKTALAAAFVAPEACWLLGAFVHVPLGLVPMWGLWAVVYTRSQLPAAQLPQRSATQRERDSREGASPHARRTLEFLRAHALYSLSLFRVGARRVTLKGCLSFVSRAGAAASVVVSVQGER